MQREVDARDRTVEDLGGGDLHARKSGVVAPADGVVVFTGVQIGRAHV